jgi:hypothetical protein
MPERATDRRRRREPGPTPADPSPLHHSTDPILALQRSAGNRSVAEMLARAPAAKGATGTVEIGGVGQIKVSGGNLEEWTGKGAPDTVELASEPGKHSAKLEKLSTARTTTDVKVTISAAQKAGEELNVGGGTVLDIKDARVKGYAVEDGVETWRLADFEAVKRTKTTRKVS